MGLNLNAIDLVNDTGLIQIMNQLLRNLVADAGHELLGDRSDGFLAIPHGDEPY